MNISLFNLFGPYSYGDSLYYIYEKLTM